MKKCNHKYYFLTSTGFLQMNNGRITNPIKCQVCGKTVEYKDDEYEEAIESIYNEIYNR